VLLPTPPFWFAIATILARPGTSGTTGPFFLDRFGFGAAVRLDGGATAWVPLAEALLTVGS
jgi:hypothetical protein